MTIDTKALMKKCRDNRDKLDACPRHFFPMPPGTPVNLGVKLECERCGGALDLVAINYYVRGYEAAGGDGNDVVTGWREPEEPKPERRYFGQTVPPSDD